MRFDLVYVGRAFVMTAIVIGFALSHRVTYPYFNLLFVPAMGVLLFFLRREALTKEIATRN